MKHKKEDILKNALLKENNSLYIQQLCIITGQTPKAVKNSLAGLKTFLKDKAEKENKTLEEVINEYNKNNNYGKK